MSIMRLAKQGKKKLIVIIMIIGITTLLYNCVPRYLTQNEVELKLEKKYGQEFKVLSSRQLQGDELSSLYWGEKVYIVVPKDEPNFVFYAFSTIAGETGGMPGIKTAFTDTYMEQKVALEFEKEAEVIGLDYNVFYDTGQFSETDFFNKDIRIYVHMDEENAYNECEKLEIALNNTKKALGIEDGDFIGLTLRILYRRTDWEEDDNCAIDAYLFSGWIESGTGLGMNAEEIYKRLLERAENYNKIFYTGASDNQEKQVTENKKFPDWSEAFKDAGLTYSVVTEGDGLQYSVPVNPNTTYEICEKIEGLLTTLSFMEFDHGDYEYAYLSIKYSEFEWEFNACSIVKINLFNEEGKSIPEIDAQTLYKDIMSEAEAYREWYPEKTGR